MPQWTTRWLAWARDNMLHRSKPRPVSVALGYERAGRTHWAAPVPWTASAVVIDVVLRAPAHARRKADFVLRLPSGTLPVEGFRAEDDNKLRLTCRVPVPLCPVRAELLWRGRVVAGVPVRVLSAAEFMGGLALSCPTVAARYGDTTVSATAFVPDGCEALAATAVLRNQTGLAPLGELGLTATFRNETLDHSTGVKVRLSAANLEAQVVVATAAFPGGALAPGSWLVTWAVGDRVLAITRFQVIPSERLTAGVRVLETRFAAETGAGPVRVAKLPPALTAVGRVGPCFLLCGSERGAARVCRFEISAISSGERQILIRREVDAVVTDAPTPFIPALFDASELGGASRFELRSGGRLLGVASLHPVPAAPTDGEGGFVPPPEFVWGSSADDELEDRLNRLTG